MRTLIAITIGLCLVAGEVRAGSGDYLLGGALSGAGQSMQQGAASIQNAIIMQELQRQRHQQEMEKIEAQEREAVARQERATQEQRARSSAIQAEQQRVSKPAPDIELVKAQSRMSQLEPNWRTIVGADGAPTPYRQWLSRQPRDYQDAILQTRDPDVLVGAIRAFQAQSK